MLKKLLLIGFVLLFLTSCSLYNTELKQKIEAEKEQNKTQFDKIKYSVIALDAALFEKTKLQDKTTQIISTADLKDLFDISKGAVVLPVCDDARGDDGADTGQFPQQRFGSGVDVYPEVKNFFSGNPCLRPHNGAHCRQPGGRDGDGDRQTRREYEELFVWIGFENVFHNAPMLKIMTIVLPLKTNGNTGCSYDFFSSISIIALTASSTPSSFFAICLRVSSIISP